MAAALAIEGAALSPVPAAAEEALAVSADISASAAVLYEPSSGRVLFEKNAHEKRPMASTTKLMTALLATELLSQEQDIIVPAKAVSVEGTTMGLKADDRISLRDLLCGLLLESGNDAANTVAIASCGSYEAFAEKMNERAAAIGMKDSVFVTPSGLDEGEHGASAYDMALLAAEVLKNDMLAAICSSTQETVSFGNPKHQAVMSNHNRLLSLYPDAIGMKTGYTSKAGRCLVSAARRDGVTLIAVTLNCPDDWDGHITLYDAGFSLLVSIPLPTPTLSELTVCGGEKDAVVLNAASPPPVTGLRGDEDRLVVTVSLPRFIWAAVKKGDTLGSVIYTLRGSVVATTPITAAETVGERAREPWLTRAGTLFRALLKNALT